MLWFKRQGAVLCRECHCIVEEDVSFRKSEIRKAMAGIRFSSAPPTALVEEAKSHLEVLVHYEEQGLARVRPEPGSMLRRLNAFSASLPPGRPFPPPAPAGRRARGEGVAAPPELDDDVVRIDGFALEDDSYWLGNDVEPPSRPAAKPAKAEPTPVWDERRTHQRKPVDFKLLINPYGYQATARDLSSGGLYIQTGSMKAYQRPFKLVFHTLEGDLETVGVVCRADKRVADEDGVEREGLGIQFMGELKELPNLVCTSGELTLSHGLSA